MSHREFDRIVQAYRDRYGVDLSRMRMKWSKHPVYTNGERSYDLDDDETGGSWVNDGTVRINPKMGPVMKRFGIEGMTQAEFRRRIIAHELAHEVWHNQAHKKRIKKLIRDSLRQAREENFTTPYLDTYPADTPKRKFDSELFAEYMSDQLNKRGSFIKRAMPVNKFTTGIVRRYGTRLPSFIKRPFSRQALRMNAMDPYHLNEATVRWLEGLGLKIPGPRSAEEAGAGLKFLVHSTGAGAEKGSRTAESMVNSRYIYMPSMSLTGPSGVGSFGAGFGGAEGANGTIPVNMFFGRSTLMHPESVVYNVPDAATPTLSYIRKFGRKKRLRFYRKQMQEPVSYEHVKKISPQEALSSKLESHEVKAFRDVDPSEIQMAEIGLGYNPKLWSNPEGDPRIKGLVKALSKKNIPFYYTNGDPTIRGFDSFIPKPDVSGYTRPSWLLDQGRFSREFAPSVNAGMAKQANAYNKKKWPDYDKYLEKHPDKKIELVERLVREHYAKQHPWGAKTRNGRFLSHDQVRNRNIDDIVIRGGKNIMRQRRGMCHELSNARLKMLRDHGIDARRLFAFYGTGQDTDGLLGHSMVFFKGDDGKYHFASPGMRDRPRKNFGVFDDLNDAVRQYIAAIKTRGDGGLTDDDYVEIHDTTDIDVPDEIPYRDFVRMALKRPKLYVQGEDKPEKKASSKKETWESGEGEVESYTPDRTENHDEIVIRLKDGRRVRISNNTKLGKILRARVGSRVGYHGYRVDGTDVVHRVHPNAHSRGGWLERIQD